MDTVLVVVQEPAPLMTVLQVHTRRQTGDIPVRIQPGVATSKSGAEAYVAQQTEEDAPDRTTVAGFSAYMPRLAVFPSAPNTDALCNVLVEMGPVTLYIFWQNSLVQTVENVSDAYPILLPGFTALRSAHWYVSMPSTHTDMPTTCSFRWKKAGW